MTEHQKNFYNYLVAGNIICNSSSKTSQEAINELVSVICNHRAGLDPALVTKEVLERESIYPTVIAPGLAVPHARLLNLNEPLIALLTSSNGIDFGDSIMGKVSVVVLVLTPGDDPGIHLQILATLANELVKDDAIKKVSNLSSAKEILEFFMDSSMSIPDYLCVKEIMNNNPVKILEHATLQEAIRIFARSKAEELPVVDSQGDLRGLLSLADILEFSLPDHILWLDDLSSIYKFQPFSEMLKTASESKVADIMREEFVSVDESVPAIQLAKLFLQHKLRQLVVTGNNGKLAGTVEVKDFCGKLFWE